MLRGEGLLLLLIVCLGLLSFFESGLQHAVIFKGIFVVHFGQDAVSVALHGVSVRSELRDDRFRWAGFFRGRRNVAGGAFARWTTVLLSLRQLSNEVGASFMAFATDRIARCCG